MGFGLTLSVPPEVIAQIDETLFDRLGADRDFKPYIRVLVVLMAAAETRKGEGDPQRARDLLDVAFLELIKFRAALRRLGVCLTPFPLDTVASVQLQLAMAHTWVGDLTMKLVSPRGTIVTLMSRPGRMEPADDGSGNGGDASDLAIGSPITFVMGAVVSSEAMGATIAGGVACQDDAICSYAPSHGAAAAGDLATFALEPAHGTWRFCVGDGSANDVGTIDRVTLNLTLR